MHITAVKQKAALSIKKKQKQGQKLLNTRTIRERHGRKHIGTPSTLKKKIKIIGHEMF